MAQMQPHTAAAVLEVFDRHGRPKTSAAAQVVVEAWLRAAGLHKDRWGNYLEKGGEARWHFKQNVVRRELKVSDGWGAATSYPLKEQADKLIQAAAKSAGRTDLAEKVHASRVTQAKARTRRAVKAQHTRDQLNGPGFYVVNQTTNANGTMATAQEYPYETVDEAIDHARERYKELVGMKFHYLLPVLVIEAQSRDIARLPLAAGGRAEGRSVWWIDGKKTGGPVDPRQMRLPGMVGGRTSKKMGWSWLTEWSSKQMAQVEMMRLRRISPEKYRVRSPAKGVWLVEQHTDVSSLPRGGKWESAADAAKRKHGR